MTDSEHDRQSMKIISKYLQALWQTI